MASVSVGIMTVWKYVFNAVDAFDLEMPEGAKLLTFQNQHETPCLWALVNPCEPKTKRRFKLVATGSVLEGGFGTDHTYVGTAQFSGGALVFHLFECVQR